MITKTGQTLKEAGLLDQGVRVGASTLNRNAANYAMRTALTGGSINPSLILSSGGNTAVTNSMAHYVEVLKNRITNFERTGGNLAQQKLMARNFALPDSAIQMPKNFDIDNVMGSIRGNLH